MEFRKANLEDLNGIMDIIKKAQDQFKRDGIDQWQNNYPNREIIKEDIEKDESYILSKDGKIIGTMFFSFGGEPDYDTIYDGRWISNDKFAVVHRVAVDLDLKGQGLASIMLEKAFQICKEKAFPSIKVDTHRENKAMQRLLEKNGFTLCGLIYLKDGGERLAFEKTIN